MSKAFSEIIISGIERKLFIQNQNINVSSGY